MTRDEAIEVMRRKGALEVHDALVLANGLEALGLLKFEGRHITTIDRGRMPGTPRTPAEVLDNLILGPHLSGRCWLLDETDIERVLGAFADAGFEFVRRLKPIEAAAVRYDVANYIAATVRSFKNLSGVDPTYAAEMILLMLHDKGLKIVRDDSITG